MGKHSRCTATCEMRLHTADRERKEDEKKFESKKLTGLIATLSSSKTPNTSCKKPS